MSWNARGLTQDKLDTICIESQAQAPTVICVQEVHGSIVRNDGDSIGAYRVYQVTRQSHSERGGLAMLIHCDYTVKSYQADSTSQLVVLDTSAGEVGICNVYIPPVTSKYAQITFLEYLDNVQQMLQSAMLMWKHCTFLVCGDFNARTGATIPRLQEAPACLPVATKFYSADAAANARGKQLQRFATDYLWQQLNGVAGKSEYTRYDRQHSNSVIDYMFYVCNTQQPCKFDKISCIVDATSGALSVSDHALLLCTLQLPCAYSTQQQLSNQQFVPFRDVVPLCGRVDDMQSMFATVLEAHNNASDPSEYCNHVEQCLLQCAKLTCPEYNPVRARLQRKSNPNKLLRANQPWYDRECIRSRDALQQARRAYGMQSEQRRQAYNSYRLLLRAKRAHFLDGLEQLRLSQPRDFYRLLQKRTPAHMCNLRDLHRHYEQLLCAAGTGLPTESVDSCRLDIDYLAMEDVQAGIMLLHANKAAGAHWITAELVKVASAAPAFCECLCNMYNLALRTGLPDAWQEVTITSLYKKGEQSDPNNYRGLSVLTIWPKLLALILHCKLEVLVSGLGLRAPTQAGFRRGYRVEDNALLLRTAIQRCTSRGLPLYCLFIDLAKAYDTVQRDLLWSHLADAMCDSDPNMPRALQSLYVGLRARLAEDGDGSLGSIPIRIGVKQGCPLSPLLFSCFFDRVYSYVAERLADGVTSADMLYFISVQLWLLLFADDVVLLSPTMEGLQHMFLGFAQFCDESKLNINSLKTELMVCGKQGARYGPNCSVTFHDRFTFKCCREFKYLGLHFDQFASSSHMIGQVLSKARKAFMWLLSFVCKQQWNTPHTRLVLCDVYVRSLLQFGCPVWAPSQLCTGIGIESKVLKPLLVQQRKCIRALLGLSQRTHNYLLFALSGRMPLQVALSKMCLRYFQRVYPYLDNAQSSDYPTLARVAKWAHSSGNDTDMSAGIQLCEVYPTVADIYVNAKSFLKNAALSDVQVPVCIRSFWSGVFDIMFGKQDLPLALPKGYTVDSWQAVVPGGWYGVDTHNRGIIRCLNRPGWLLHNQPTHLQILEHFYTHIEWLGCAPGVGAQTSLIFDYSYSGWSTGERALLSFAQLHSLAYTVWIFPKQVIRMIHHVMRDHNSALPLEWDTDCSEY